MPSRQVIRTSGGGSVFVQQGTVSGGSSSSGTRSARAPGATAGGGTGGGGGSSVENFRTRVAAMMANGKSRTQAIADFNANHGTRFTAADLGGAGGGGGGGAGGGGTLIPPVAEVPGYGTYTPPGGPPSGPTPPSVVDVNPPTDYRNAEALIKGYFAQIGLPASLATWAFQQLREGLDPDTIFLLAQERPEWKQRFVGNERRKQLGLAVISPGEYMQLENDYANIFRNYGVPVGLYDNPADFAEFIGYGVSPTELAARVELAKTRIGQAPAEIKAKLNEYYGIDEGELLGYVLDPTRGLEFIEQRIRASEVAGIASLHSLGIAQGRAEQLAGLGVDREAAAFAYPQIGAELSNEALSSFLAPRLSQVQLEDALFQQGLSSLSLDERIRQRRRVALSAAGRSQGGPLIAQTGVAGLARER